MRRFELHRDHDVSGVSGTGLVAEGALFSDGVAVVRWLTDIRSTVVWEDVPSRRSTGTAGRRASCGWTPRTDSGGGPVCPVGSGLLTPRRSVPAPRAGSAASRRGP